MDDHSDDLRRVRPSRIEVYAGIGRRRWDDALKAQIVVESWAPGAVVTQVARKHGCRPQQIHEWRKLARQGDLALPGERLAPLAQPDSEPLFVPLVSQAAHASSSCVGDATRITIEFEGAIVRVYEQPGAEALAQVFTALRRSRSC
jgi:transposase